MSKGGGAPGFPPIQVQTPPPPHTWLAGHGPATGAAPIIIDFDFDFDLTRWRAGLCWPL